VGSDFWNSAEFYRDYRRAVEAGFRPIGKFGIGFLSVFMLGDQVEVETESLGNERLRLTLFGVGKRGVLQEIKATGYAGTEVRSALRDKEDGLLEKLPDVVRARAPMLTIPVTVNLTEGGETRTHRIEPGWWKRMPDEAIIAFTSDWESYSYSGTPFVNDPRYRRMRYHPEDYRGSRADLGGKWSVKGWPGAKPQHVDDSKRLLSQGGETSYGVICCSQGIAVQTARFPDVTGLFEVGEVDLTVSRESIADLAGLATPAANTQMGAITDKIASAIRPAVLAKINELHAYGMLPGRIRFLRGMAAIFGRELRCETSLKWIPLTLPPGDLIHRSRQELLEDLGGQSRILLSAGANPGSTYAVGSSHIPAAELGRMMVLSINIEEIEVTYAAKNRFDEEKFGGVIKGSLDRILSVVSDDSRSRSETHSEAELNSRLFLTTFLIECIAMSWGMSSAALRGQNWYLHYQDNVLLGDLRRS
jgi:hypothetical protein